MYALLALAPRLRGDRLINGYRAEWRWDSIKLNISNLYIFTKIRIYSYQ